MHRAEELVRRVEVAQRVLVQHLAHPQHRPLERQAARSERTRHIHNKDMFVRNLVRAKEITIKYVKSAENIADFFTKILGPTVYRTFRDRIMGVARE